MPNILMNLFKRNSTNLFGLFSSLSAYSRQRVFINARSPYKLHVQLHVHGRIKCCRGPEECAPVLLQIWRFLERKDCDLYISRVIQAYDITSVFSKVKSGFKEDCGDVKIWRLEKRVTTHVRLECIFSKLTKGTLFFITCADAI